MTTLVLIVFLPAVLAWLAVLTFRLRNLEHKMLQLKRKPNFADKFEFEKD